MSLITPSSHIASISGRLSRTDSVHTRANKTTGKTYGVALCHPNPQTHPTAAQQQVRRSFRDTWHAVDALLAVPALRTYFTALWQARPAFDAIPIPAIDTPIVESLTSLLSKSLPPKSLLSTPYSLLSNLRSRRTPFSTPRTLLFHLLYP